LQKEDITMRRGQRGFTLVELLVVIAILGVLAGTVTVAVVRHLDYAKVERAKVDIKGIQGALDSYRINLGDYPNASEGLQALITAPTSLTNTSKWHGPYLKMASVPKDPWDNDYLYMIPGESGREYDITSYGKDGEPGGEGLNADITSYNID